MGHDEFITIKYLSEINAFQNPMISDSFSEISTSSTQTKATTQCATKSLLNISGVKLSSAADEANPNHVTISVTIAVTVTVGNLSASSSLASGGASSKDPNEVKGVMAASTKSSATDIDVDARSGISGISENEVSVTFEKLVSVGITCLGGSFVILLVCDSNTSVIVGSGGEW